MFVLSYLTETERDSAQCVDFVDECDAVVAGADLNQTVAGNKVLSGANHMYGM